MRNNKRRLYFKNIYKTLVRLEQLERSRTKVKKKLQALACCLFCYPKTLELNSCAGNEQQNRTRSIVICMNMHRGAFHVGFYGSISVSCNFIALTLL